MTSVTLKVEGMHCEGCAQTIEALLGVEPGVQRATVSFKAREAQVQFDPKATDDARLAAAIERAGYKVVVAGQ
jgi:copper chaperone CopZ